MGSRAFQIARSLREKLRLFTDSQVVDTPDDVDLGSIRGTYPYSPGYESKEILLTFENFVALSGFILPAEGAVQIRWEIRDDPEIVAFFQSARQIYYTGAGIGITSLTGVTLPFYYTVFAQYKQNDGIGTEVINVGWDAGFFPDATGLPVALGVNGAQFNAPHIFRPVNLQNSLIVERDNNSVPTAFTKFPAIPRFIDLEILQKGGPPGPAPPLIEIDRAHISLHARF